MFMKLLCDQISFGRPKKKFSTKSFNFHQTLPVTPFDFFWPSKVILTTFRAHSHFIHIDTYSVLTDSPDPKVFHLYADSQTRFKLSSRLESNHSINIFTSIDVMNQQKFNQGSDSATISIHQSHLQWSLNN